MKLCNDDIKIISDNLDRCCTCKHYDAALCHPTTSSNTWESWEYNEVAVCRRYPPIFIAKDTSSLDDDGANLHPINFQHPSIYAFTFRCGEYEEAAWVADTILPTNS